MNNEKFRLMIEAGDLQGLKDVLAINSKLVNQSVAWHLNQNNESDPLHYVCDCVFNDWLEENRAYEIAELFINTGALLEGSEGKESPLIAATSLGLESVAKLLVDSGADIEATAVFGARPLHWAASMGLVSTVELLIAKGAEIEVKCTEFGATPLYWAIVGFGGHGPHKTRDPLGTAKVLLDNGANLNTSNNQGRSALKCSQEAESNEMYDLLIKYSGNEEAL